MHHFHLRKKGITLFLLNHCLKKQYNLFHITVTSLLEGIPMGPDPAPFFEELFLAHKGADWVKSQRNLGTINVQNINNSFRFIDDLL